MENYKCSVVMTTYNGEKYIVQQMESIRKQTRPFDEVIILDDCSIDHTPEMIKKYISDYQLDSWSFVQNKTNQGWKKNFKNGFDLASGDLIFPCDQDDIWHRDKCEKMLQVMRESCEIDLLVSNYTLFFSSTDHGSSAYKSSEKRMKNDSSVQVLTIDPKWAYILRPGCTYCFRKTFYDDIKEKWDVKYPHDAVLWRFARIRGKMGIINESLIDFRRHGDNATTVKVRTKEQRIQTFEDYIVFHRIALSYPLKDKDSKIIEKGIKFLEKRKKLYLTRNVTLLPELILFYGKYYLSLKSLAGDLYFCFRNIQKNG